jgi:hypothetical protein
MQVLVILGLDDHRIEVHPAAAQPPASLRAWPGGFPARMPFTAAWASVHLHDEAVSEIINGYVPPPDGR